jgi:hypothetical protein
VAQDEQPGGMNPLLSPALFVGRDQQSARLTQLLHHGQSTVLIGGRRAGKTTLARHLTSDGIDRALVYTDASGWDLKDEPTALGGLLSAVKGQPETAWDQATRSDVTTALAAVKPVALAIDEADRILLAPWAGSFFSFLRWLDDTYLRTDLAIVLIGGPVLMLFKDPDDRGSPPLNTAEPTFMDSLDQAAVEQLANLAGQVDQDEVMLLGGGQAWLTIRLLAEVWNGTSLDDAADTVFDGSIATFRIWERQLGSDGRELFRKIPPDGLLRRALRQAGWSRHREAARLGRSVGALRLQGDRLCRGPQLFTDWFTSQSPAEFIWDIAISYASEDLSMAREISQQLHGEFKVFFAPAEDAPLWGTDLSRVLPNTYGVQSRYVLVLSTPHYVTKYWTRMEYDAVAARSPDRILLLDLGELPPNLPQGLVYRGSSKAELIGLVGALRTKLGA